MQQLLTTLFCSLASLYAGFRLGRGTDAFDRRRAFKSQVRVMAEETGEEHAMYLWRVLERCAPIVRQRSIEIIDDVPFWKRRHFRRLCGEYLSLTGDQIAPKDHPDDATRKKQYTKPREAMKALLEDIANAA